MTTKLQQKAERLLRIDSRRKAYHRALASLHKSAPASPEEQEKLGLKMWRKLRRLEAIAHDAATAQCNGERYGSQPFREPEEWEEFEIDVEREACRIFGGSVPLGFHINGDARGMALLIDCGRGNVPDGMIKNWGEDGILAAEINE